VNKKILLFFLLYTLHVTLYTCLAHTEIEFLPLASLQVLGGQYFFEKESASFGGNIYLDIIPALKFTDELSLVPTYSAGYRGTKNVTELVGGGTLTQQAMDHSLTLKFVNQITEDIKLKLKTGYKLELLKETKDESWGNGLFDYEKIAAGIEGEKKINKKLDSLTGGYGFYKLKFKNYASLAEKEYGQELAGKIGKNVLDSNAHEVYLYSNFVFTPDLQAKGDYSFTYKDFFDQKVVTSSGDYSKDKRKDQIHLLDLLVSYLQTYRERIRVVYALGLQTVVYQSNQNHYDAKNFKFVPNYYNYWEQGIKPEIVFYIGRLPYAVDFSYQFTYREYLERLTQDTNGNYLSNGGIHTNISTISLGISYPFGPKEFIGKISLRIQANYLISKSNMKYEKLYRYNYDTANYFLGINWEY